ncbi:cell surface protein SprA [Reichenbachiella agarivorans]|uniref:Cell surface protein SprA n=1 Tax=Reichenbachiella agarivorans TaxID=2979464 RepID=A0ABY6CSE0_9BACT|nr:cell surface protein SprA [Reichenbachiella agarivorans]UXP33259.1 cell surface protein SprA [Reichenbachiella agarivorans]
MGVSAYAWQQIPFQSDTTKQSKEYKPTYQPTFRYDDRHGDPFSNSQSHTPLQLKDPSNMTVEVEMDSNNNYTIHEKVGALNYRPRSTMTFEQYRAYQDEQLKRQYWQERSAGLDGESAVSGRRLIPLIYISPMFDRIFGGNYVDIQPTGFVNMDFGGRWQTIENPNVPTRNQRTGGFNYNQQISMNVVGKVGEKLAVTANFDNNNSFDFQNNLKIEYTGYEEDIIKKIELGNVSMPIANTLITGGQSLFGVKTQLQFGKLYVTALASRQQGSSKTKSFSNGTEGTPFDIRASDYDQYRHFFLGHFFRDNYEKWLKNIPNVVSGVKISRLEVYVVKQQTETSGLRGIVAFTDLGEPVKIGNTNGMIAQANEPNDNGANNLYADINGAPAIRDISTVADYLKNSQFQMTEGVDFEARPSVKKLDQSEYTFNDRLGYVTLNSRLREGEVLAVSYEYTYNGISTPYQVGELSENYQVRPDEDLIVLKLLLPAKNTTTDVPIWDLAMKNIYNLGGSRINQEGFELRINYRDDINNYDAPNLNEGQNTNNIPLIRVFKLDQLNVNGDNQPDGNFDFIDGLTFDEEYGNIIFPVLEPFGTTLEAAFISTEQNLKDKYVYSELYDRTKTLAEQVSAKNKFRLTGNYSSSARNVYNLEGFNIAEGSVTVTAGSTLLTEGLDYEVSYLGSGQVTILNEGVLNSGKTINITYEVDDLFSFQSKWLTGTRLDYQFNDKINVGATLLHLEQRTGGVSRYSMGNEPISNTKYGFDVNFQEDSRLLTKMVDALPLISTKETSTVTFNGEFAQLIPGTSNEVDGEGTSYVDDFENAATPFRLDGNHTSWSLGAAPEAFQVTDPNSSLGAGFKRAKLAWYVIDQTLYGNSRPSSLKEDDLKNNYVKPVYPQDIFKQQDLSFVNVPERIFDLAYYPSERGPYNYNTSELDQDGRLRNPSDKFGAITRAVPTSVDFTKNNIEYIEFWLMNPFSNDPVLDGTINQPNNDQNGYLILNLGEVSEDVLPDVKHAFENGLPANGGIDNTEDTEWGRVTTQQFLTQYFDNSSSARSNQDVGLDGLKSVNGADFEEFEYFSNKLNITESALPSGAVRDQIKSDFSADDFKHYLDPEYSASNAKILERYKHFNGQEGNSPVESNNSSYSSSATNIPDNEDLNQDNFVNQTESYFEYRIPINTNSLKAGEGYVVDEVIDDDANWYLFRIPINKGTAVGSPDMQFLRYMRMYMTGWENPVVLRMARFQMVASQWRKYTLDLAESGLGEIPEVVSSDFELSVVGVEQNSSPAGGVPPYMVPPGINRDLDNTTSVTRRVNEQSLKLCVEDVDDGDARSAYKNSLNLDMVNYGKLKMFFHAESNQGEMILDDEVSAFVRLGFDQTNNYYEIEVPLKITPNGLSSYTDRDIWPEENEMNIALNELHTLKSARNADDFDVTRRYTQLSSDGKYKLSIIGNPKLSGVTDMMIGVRNPTSDDKGSKSVCIWVNEMRLTDFDKEKGWAANAQMNVKLADFATLNAATRYTSVGFGGIQQTISERTREETFEYDLSANVNVDKLIPVETGIKIPMFVSTSKSVETPRYDPLDDDIPLEASLEKFDTQKEKDEYREKVISQTTNRSINFINVRKEKVKQDAKSHVYDVENFSFNYSFSEQKSSNVNTAQRVDKQYSGGVAYNYTTKAPSIEPFKETKAFSSPYLKMIKDINFSPLPNSFSFRASMDRRFQKTQLRNSDLTTDGIDPNFEKYFTFDRSYNVRWSLFKNLSLNYNATARAIIDEPEGDIDTDAKRDSIWSNIKRLGRIKNYNQNISLNYRLPLDKIPLTDWMSADYRYSVDYTWTGGNIDQVEEFGNVISNQRGQDLSGKVDFVRLYNKSKYLSNINKPPSRSRTSRYDTVRSTGGMDAFKGVMRLMMALRSINLTYGLKESTSLPGMLPSPYMLGMDRDFNAPGWDFVLGSQDPEIRTRAAKEEWLVKNGLFTAPFIQSRTEDINLRAAVEPFKDFRIQIDAKRNNRAEYQEIYRWDSLTVNTFNSLTPTRTGSYTISFLPIATAFSKDNSENVSDVFEQFVENRAIVQARQNAANPAGEYAINSQDVLIPALIAAYTDQSANTINLLPFPKTPMPNWRVDYAGLSKLAGIKEVFSSVNLTHAYTSSFSVSNYSNSLKYSNVADLDLTNDILDYPRATQPGDDGKLIPVYIISQVDIVERFSPLIGVSVRTKGMFTGKVDYAKERSISFDLSNTQVREIKSNNISFDIGITKDTWKIPFKVKGRTIAVDNQLAFRMGFTIRDTKTIQRKIEDGNTITDGNINYQVRPTLSYVASQKLNLTMYFEKNINEPKISSSYNRSSSSFGVQVRFSLAQ